MPVYTSTGQLVSEQDPNYAVYAAQNANPSIYLNYFLAE